MRRGRGGEGCRANGKWAGNLQPGWLYETAAQRTASPPRAEAAPAPRIVHAATMPRVPKRDAGQGSISRPCSLHPSLPRGIAYCAVAALAAPISLCAPETPPGNKDFPSTIPRFCTFKAIGHSRASVHTPWRRGICSEQRNEARSDAMQDPAAAARVDMVSHTSLGTPYSA